MSHPTEADDGWADLYRELGVESRPTAAAPAHHAPAPAAAADEEFGVIEGDGPDAGYDPAAVVGEESDDTTDLEAGEDQSEEAGVVEGEPGGDGPKKRRRRRRRRRKGGPAGAEGAVAVEGEAEAGGDDAAPEEEVAYAAVAADEGPAPESGRELIANWNVPSWQEIVAGLHRPDR